MNWKDVLTLRTWTPLSEVATDELEQVMDGIFKVGPCVYLRTQNYNKFYEIDSPDAPFVTMAYWSSSVDGIKRVVAGDASLNIAAPFCVPPAELSLGTTGRYLELIKCASSCNMGKVERAFYSNKGEFLKRVIEIDRFSYCFLSHEDVDEPAFLIEISLLS